MIEPVSVPILMDVDISPEEYYLEIETEHEISVEVGTTIQIVPPGIGYYEGPYVVDPDIVEKTLPTENKLMTDNVIVHEIPMRLAIRNQIDRMF